MKIGFFFSTLGKQRRIIERQRQTIQLQLAKNEALEGDVNRLKVTLRLVNEQVIWCEERIKISDAVCETVLEVIAATGMINTSDAFIRNLDGKLRDWEQDRARYYLRKDRLRQNLRKERANDRSEKTFPVGTEPDRPADAGPGKA
jgi:hypothetical protein